MADFFDKMLDGINKGVATVSTGSKAMLEKSRITTIIKNLESEKKQLAEVLGNKVYNFCQNNAEGDIPRADVINFCNEINARNEQIAEQQKKIEAIDAEVNQVKGASAAFNPNTGAAMVPCSCGHMNSAGAKFCAKCGTKLI